MNIFWLDKDLKECAKQHCDKHVVKMMVEYTQLLSASSRLAGAPQGYKLSHKGHPCTKWLLESEDNWKTLWLLGMYLGEEYTYRYHNVHKSHIMLKSLELPNLPKKGFSAPPQCVPDDCKSDNFIVAYRQYYIKYKRYFAVWTNRPTPEWYLSGIQFLKDNK